MSGDQPVDVPIDSIVELAQKLVRVPSQGDLDSCEPVLAMMRGWVEERGVEVSTLFAEDAPVAVVGSVGSGTPTYCLDAPLDTAPVGDQDAWEYDPFSGTITDGRLYGRGSADSKVAVAIFAHLMVELQQSRQNLRGRVLALFDGDEHSGEFAGVKRFVANEPHVDGVMIGYPGNYGVTRGARGFYRVEVELFGTGGHSGGRRKLSQSAIEKAALLVTRLGEIGLNQGPPDFPLYPAITVTSIDAGSDSFSMVPGACRLRIDFRLTPVFERPHAKELLSSELEQLDSDLPGRRRATIREFESWPSYRLPDKSPVGAALRAAAREHHNPELDFVVCGPSNIGNYLAWQGIEATCGFGVSYQNIHAPNEWIELADIPMVYKTYRGALRRLLSSRHKPDVPTPSRSA